MAAPIQAVLIDLDGTLLDTVLDLHAAADAMLADLGRPPVAVADAFQSVVGAMEEREAQILDARAYAVSKIPVAAAEATSAFIESSISNATRKISLPAWKPLNMTRIVQLAWRCFFIPTG